MKKRNLFLALIGSLVFAGCKDETEIIVVNDEEAQEVWFEDVATNVRVVPLVSEEPIGSIRNMICYGNEIIALDNDKKTVYYFDNGTLVSKMNHEGRGRGEYVDIKRYAYSPSKKVLYVVADDKILWYSVPGMRYCGNTPISYTMNLLTMHDDDHFFGVICKDQRFLAALIDIETGEITNEIEEISMYNHEESNISMSSYSKERHYYSKSDYNNTIVTVRPDSETKVLLKYNFGDKSIPEKYLDFDLKNPMNFGKLFEYMDENGKTRLLGNQFLRIKGNEISFWYYYAVGSMGVKNYFRYNIKDKTSTNLKGFRIKGINRPIMPFTVSDDGYIALFEGNPGWYKTDEEASSLAESILHEMENQEINNPVVLYYDIE